MASSLLSPRAPGRPDPEDVEVRLLLQGLFEAWGPDFRGYALDAVRPGIRRVLREEGAASVSALQSRLLREPELAGRVVRALSDRGEGLFGDPRSLRWIRARIVPWLRTYASVRVWIAGCGDGETACAFAILLEEEGLGRRARVYATDVPGGIGPAAESGVVEGVRYDRAAARWRRAGGRAPLSAWVTRARSGIRLRPSVRSRIHFAAHSLVTDASFNEFHVILCPNALSRLGPGLQRRAREVLHRSLGTFGFLGLGPGETMEGSPYAGLYTELAADSPFDWYWRRP
jgi:chemotaxis protein methyltransferase CheR